MVQEVHQVRQGVGRSRELLFIERPDFPKAGGWLAIGTRRIEDEVEPAPRLVVTLVLHQSAGDKERNVEEQLPVEGAVCRPMIKVNVLARVRKSDPTGGLVCRLEVKIF